MHSTNSITRFAEIECHPMQKYNDVWTIPFIYHLRIVAKKDLTDLLPECPPIYQSLLLLYLMVTCKQHKSKYHWLTNAFQTLFSSIFILLTLTSNVILDKSVRSNMGKTD